MKLRLLIVSMLIFSGSVQAMESTESANISDSQLRIMSDAIVGDLKKCPFDAQLEALCGYYSDIKVRQVLLSLVSFEYFVQAFIASLKHAEPTQKVKNDALLKAIKGNYPWIVSILFEFGVKIEALSRNDQIPFYQAVGKGSTEILKKLMEKGLDVNVRDNDGKTILYYAVLEGNKDVVKMLMDNGASFRVPDKQEKSLLDYAYEKKDTELVAFFYSYNFPSSVQFLEIPKRYINISDKNGKTVLHYAVLEANKELVKWLIDQGASVNAKDKDSLSPYNYATNMMGEDGKYAEIINILVDCKK